MEKKNTTVNMSVSGEFLTQLARTMLWDDKRPYEECENFLKSALFGLPENESSEIIQKILEGRLKLTGTNVYTLKEDNEQVRSVLDLLKEQQKEQVLLSIKENMRLHFIRYVDPYSTVKSMHTESQACNNFPETYDECRNYFLYTDNKELPVDEQTFNGLWLIYYPNLVYQITMGNLKDIGSDIFWEKIYQATKDWDFLKDRNKKYLAVQQMKKDKQNSLNIQYKNFLKKKENAVIKPRYLSKEWFQYKEKTDMDGITFRMTPDDMENWEGLISPSGDFYSCLFGGHSIKAYYIITTHPEWFGFTPNRNDGICEHPCRADRALDLLLEHGWCATRYISSEHYVSVPILPKQLTKAQQNCILMAMDKFRVRIDMSIFD